MRCGVKENDYKYCMGDIIQSLLFRVRDLGKFFIDNDSFS